MKNDDMGNTEMLHFPIEETTAVIAAMKMAEKAGDLPALQWCARRLIQLHELFEDDSCFTDEPYIPSKAFNRLWSKELEVDPPPAGIKW